MFSYSKAIVCQPDKGCSIERFAEDLLDLRHYELGVIVGVFNDIALFVHSGDTVQDIVHQYINKR